MDVGLLAPSESPLLASSFDFFVNLLSFSKVDAEGDKATFSCGDFSLSACD